MSARTAHHTIRIAPMVMAESATLNVGKSLTCTKSTTAPFRNPGVRNSRSMRLPSAPPSTSDRPTTISVSRVRRTVRTRITATTMATTARNGVNAWNRLNALPVLRTSTNPTSSNSRIGSSGSTRTAHHLLSWSRATTPRTMAVARSGRPARAGADLGPGEVLPVVLPVLLAASLGTSLAVDAGLGVRQSLEAFEVDAAAGGQTHAVGAGSHPLERPVDLVDDLLRRGREQQVALALDVDRVALARLLVELGVAPLTLGRELVGFGLEDGGLLHVARPLLEQAGLEALDGLRGEARLLGLHLEAREGADDGRGLAGRLLDRFGLGGGSLLGGGHLLDRCRLLDRNGLLGRGRLLRRGHLLGGRRLLDRRLLRGRHLLGRSFLRRSGLRDRSLLHGGGL